MNFSKLVIITALNGLLIVSLCVPYFIATRSEYVRVGPSSRLQIAGIVIDTYVKYWIAVCIIIIERIFTTYRSLVVYPWITNTIYDHKTLEIGMTRKQAMWITNSNNIMDAFMGLFYVLIQISQIDFALISVACAGIASYYSSRMYIQPKQEYILVA